MNAQKTAKKFMQRVTHSCTKMHPQREFELLNQLINIIEAAQQERAADVCPSCGVDDWAYGDDEHTFEVCAMCGKPR